MPLTLHRPPYTISTDPALLDAGAIHAYLTTSYWAAGISLATVERSLRHSLCVGLFHESAQVGLARIISDFATFAYLCDVYVLESHRGRGLSTWLMEAVIAHPDLQGLRRICLFTRDAHGLYTRYGFKPHPDFTRYLEVHNPYRAAGS